MIKISFKFFILLSLISANIVADDFKTKTKFKAQYPKSAYAKRISGYAIVEFVINEKGRTKAGGGWISSIETGEVPQPVRWNPFDWYEKTDLWKNFKEHAPDIKLIHISGGEPLINQKQYELLENLMVQTKFDCVASGGVSNILDLINLKKKNYSQMKGVIVGKAIYDKNIDIAEALKIVR